MAGAFTPVDGLPWLDVEACRLVSDGDYHAWLLDRIEQETRSIRVAVFIVHPLPADDRDGRVRAILDALADAAWRRVDVRIVLGTGREGSPIDTANRVAAGYLERRGVPVRMVRAPGGASLHDKIAVFGEREALLGSHNWSPNALGRSREDSVWVRSTPLARVVAHHLDRLWFDGLRVDLSQPPEAGDAPLVN